MLALAVQVCMLGEIFFSKRRVQVHMCFLDVHMKIGRGLHTQSLSEFAGAFSKLLLFLLLLLLLSFSRLA